MLSKDKELPTAGVKKQAYTDQNQYADIQPTKGAGAFKHQAQNQSQTDDYDTGAGPRRDLFFEAQHQPA